MGPAKATNKQGRKPCVGGASQKLRGEKANKQASQGGGWETIPTTKQNKKLSASQTTRQNKGAKEAEKGKQRQQHTKQEGKRKKEEGRRKKEEGGGLRCAGSNVAYSF